MAQRSRFNYLMVFLSGIGVAVAFVGVTWLRFRPKPILPNVAHVPVKLTTKSPTLTTQWALLCETSGCLTGGQDWSPKMSEGCVFRAPAWTTFLTLPRSKVVPFLLERMDSWQRTHVHVCPYQPAYEGELAVYALQQILQTNVGDSQQEELWKRLKSSQSREQLKAIFRKAARSYTSPVGLEGEAARRYRITIPEGWTIQYHWEDSPSDEAAARSGIAELHLRQANDYQKVIVIRIVEESRVHPHQGLALAFHEINGDTHVPMKEPWQTDHGVEGEVFKDYQADGRLLGYKIVSPTCYIGYLDVSLDPLEASSITPAQLRQLAQELFASFRILTPDGVEVKD